MTRLVQKLVRTNVQREQLLLACPNVAGTCLGAGAAYWLLVRIQGCELHQLFISRVSYGSTRAVCQARPKCVPACDTIRRCSPAQRMRRISLTLWIELITGARGRLQPIEATTPCVPLRLPVRLALAARLMVTNVRHSIYLMRSLSRAL
jgi:hypothetical protein